MTPAQKPQPLPSGRGWGQCQKSLPFGIPHGLHPTHLMHRFVEDAIPYANKPAAAERPPLVFFCYFQLRFPFLSQLNVTVAGMSLEPNSPEYRIVT